MSDLPFDLGPHETPPTPPPAPARPGMTLPRSAYLWLLILVLSYALPPLIKAVLPKTTPSAATAAESGLSTQDFERYVEAETQTRTAFAGDLFPGLSDGAAAGKVKSARIKALNDATTLYRQLAQSTLAPNMARRVLLLTHAQKKPFNEKTLTALLVPALQNAKTTPNARDAEIALWRGVLGPTPHLAFAAIPDAVRRVKAMHLQFLEDLALSDVYRAAGDQTNADRFANRLEAKGSEYQSAQLKIIGGIVVGGLTGLVLLLLFLVAALGKNWSMIARVPTAPQAFGWGDLLDSFVFYLAVFKGISLLVSVPLMYISGSLGTRERLGIILLIEVIIGLLAAAYTYRTARRRGTTLTDIGLTTRGNLLGNIGYGIAGYLAGLPLLFGMGFLAKQLFQHSTNTAPNPVIPLMVGEHDPFGRFLIFFLASVYAPLFEEFFFRGVLFSGLRTRFPWGTSAVISALCFAALHPIQDWLPIFALGFTLATLREMRQSLVPGMTAHFLQNTMTFIFMSTLFR